MRINRCTAILLAALLVSCGGDGGAPTGSTIIMNPSSISWTVPGDSALFTEKHLITISVTNAGNPVRGATVQVFSDLADGSTTGLEVMELRETANGAIRTSPIEVKTNDFGTAQVYLDVWLGQVAGAGLAYRGNLQAFSGAAFASVSVTVTCTDTDPLTATVCD